jgi:asparagine synthase (glutamine-hydrolysing)
MCGIAGVVGRSSENITSAMISELNHRGPDQAGVTTMGNVSLGIARLSIVDTAGGMQPIFNENRSMCIVLNGEIYNHNELRQMLIQKGHKFNSSSDTEVILHLYEEYGVECLKYLNGMFAFAITDGDKVFIARDKVGIKPIYYLHKKKEGFFAFASEIKVLVERLGVSPEIDPIAVNDWAVLGHPVDTSTFIKDVKLLQPASYFYFRVSELENTPQSITYFNYGADRDESITIENAEELVYEALVSSILNHSVTEDDRLGLVLSGGLDSTLMAKILSRYRSGQLMTFTVADSKDHPDVEQAEIVAKSIKSLHETYIFSDKDFLAAMPHFVATEEMASDMTDLPHFMMNEFVAKKTKVCLNGEGADEFFGGYREFVDQEQKINLISSRLRRLVEAGGSISSEAQNLITPLFASNYEKYLPSIFEYNRQASLDRAHLHRVDKYGMAYGLENRVPFLSNEMISLATKLPLQYLVNKKLGIRKHLLRKVLVNKFGPSMLDIALREKYTFPSSGNGFSARLDSWLKEKIPKEAIVEHPIFRITGDYLKMLSFDLFSEIFIKGVSYKEINVIDFLLEKYKITDKMPLKV